jgi:uncharacterized RDD family membrane protein YckC
MIPTRMEYEDHRTISTPEGVQLELPLAGIGSRFMALIIDSLIELVVLLAAVLGAYAIGGEVAATIVGLCGVLAAYVGYHVVMEVFGGGRTLGKRATGLRVVTDGGAQVGLRASLIRNFLRLLEGVATFYVPAMISVLATKNNQRLGDLAGGTLVVRDQRPASVVAPSAPFVEPERFANWDVTGIGEGEASAVRAFLERRSNLRPGARRALAQQLAGNLRPLVAGVRPGLEDETFLEHLAAAKARGKMRESAEDGH